MRIRIYYNVEKGLKVRVSSHLYRTKETMPLDRAGLFSFITYSWLTKYMKRAYEHGLKKDDIPLCSTKDSCDHAAQRCREFYLLFYLKLQIMEITGLVVCGMRK